MGLDTVIINDITLGRILTWLLVAVMVYALPKACRLLFKRRTATLQHMVYVVCDSCGWEGHISKFGNRCPKCGATVNLPNGGGASG